jgi:ABC-2 type transport system permease protein
MKLVVAIVALMRVSIMTALQYRSDFLLQAITGALRTFGAVAPLLLVYHHTNVVAGWTADEAMLVMALFLVLSGYQGTLLEPNLGEVVDAIRTGSLDLWLMKPIDSQLLVSFRRVDPASIWDVIAGIAVGAWALRRLPELPSGADFAVAAFVMGCGLVAMYGLWIIAISTSFFFVRVDNLRFLLMAVADAGRWPLQVFSSWVRLILVIVVPVGVVTGLPADALRGAWSFQTALVGALVGFGFLLAARTAWTWSVRYYTSAAS